MRMFVLYLALLINTDPVTLFVICFLATICAFIMRELLPNPWMALLIYPLLFAGGLTFVAVAKYVGVLEAIDIWVNSDGELTVRWNTVVEVLPMLLFTATLGMCVVAIGIISAVRSLARYI